jgi:hypothetical protein
VRVYIDDGHFIWVALRLRRLFAGMDFAAVRAFTQIRIVMKLFK